MCNLLLSLLLPLYALLMLFVKLLPSWTLKESKALGYFISENDSLSLATSSPSSAIFLNGFVFVPWCLDYTNQTAWNIAHLQKFPRALNEVTVPCKNDCFWDTRMELFKGNTFSINLEWVIWHISKGKLNNLKKAYLVTGKKRYMSYTLVYLEWPHICHP